MSVCPVKVCVPQGKGNKKGKTTNTEPRKGKNGGTKGKPATGKGTGKKTKGNKNKGKGTKTATNETGMVPGLGQPQAEVAGVVLGQQWTKLLDDVHRQ